MLQTNFVRPEVQL